jgi:hypothetical protein
MATNQRTESPLRGEDQKAMTAQRHSDWWKHVPTCLKKPLRTWRGPPPTGSADPAWQKYQQQRIKHIEHVVKELTQQWGLDPRVQDAQFWHDMTVNLVELFPAFQVLKETRGNKRISVIEPESAKRRIRRDRQRGRA